MSTSSISVKSLCFVLIVEAAILDVYTEVHSTNKTPSDERLTNRFLRYKIRQTANSAYLFLDYV